MLLKAGPHDESTMIQHRTAVPLTLPGQARCSCQNALGRGHGHRYSAKWECFCGDTVIAYRGSYNKDGATTSTPTLPSGGTPQGNCPCLGSITAISRLPEDQAARQRRVAESRDWMMIPSDDEAMSGGSGARFEWERLATDVLTRSVVKEGQFQGGNIEIN